MIHETNTAPEHTYLKTVTAICFAQSQKIYRMTNYSNVFCAVLTLKIENGAVVDDNTSYNCIYFL